MTPSEGPTGALLSLLFFPLFFLIPILSGLGGARAPKLTPVRGSIVSGGLCYSRVDAGVSGPDKPGSLAIYSRLFQGPAETRAPGGAGAGAPVGPPLFLLSQASTPGQRAREGGGRGAAGVTDLTSVSARGGVGGRRRSSGGETAALRTSTSAGTKPGQASPRQ